MGTALEPSIYSDIQADLAIESYANYKDQSGPRYSMLPIALLFVSEVSNIIIPYH